MTTRPADGGPIATDWGQDVHDRVYDPKGDYSGSGTTLSLTTSVQKCDIGDGIPGSPGGWLDASQDRLVVPSGEGGVYLIQFTLEFTGLTAAAGSSYRGWLYTNGAQDEVGVAAPSASGAVARVTACGIRLLTSGDYLEVFSANTGSSGGTATLVDIRAIRIADSLPS